MAFAMPFMLVKSSKERHNIIDFCYSGVCMQEINRLFLAPSKSFFLFGPRGTGKTTFVRSLFKNALWINLLRPEVLRKYQARPESLYEEVMPIPEIN